MSHGEAAAPKSITTRIVQAAALIVVFAVLLIATRLVPEKQSVVGTVAGLGFLLLAGTLTSELMEIAGLPHVSGYILAGLVAGPDVLSLIDDSTLGGLAPVNALALALIALAGGAELEIGMLRSSARSIAWSTALQHAIIPIIAFGAFLLLARFTPFARLDTMSLVGVALLWGVISATRSPAALLAIIAQVRPAGPLTTFSVAFVMLSDVVCVILAALVIAFVRPLFDPVAALSFEDLKHLGFEMVGSVALGACLGMGLGAYLKLIGRNRLVVLLAIGFSLSELLRYIQFDALLSFLVAGFAVRNFTDQGPKLLEAIERTGAVVFVIFFAVAGAKVDLGLLRSVGIVALALCAVRGVGSVVIAKYSSKVAGDPPVLRKWGWSSLVSQAGLSIGLTVVIGRAFPGIATEFTTLSLACITINQLIGPIAFKLGLDRSGESGQAVHQEGATVTPLSQR
ncbi:MAG: sodium:proton exchanger [Polyangiaceae bacterium]|nr:sodium:proton exchanger [Polyangiaceae bacterium]